MSVTDIFFCRTEATAASDCNGGQHGEGVRNMCRKDWLHLLDREHCSYLSVPNQAENDLCWVDALNDDCNDNFPGASLRSRLYSPQIRKSQSRWLPCLPLTAER